MFQTVLFEWTEGGRQTVSDRQAVIRQKDKYFRQCCLNGLMEADRQYQTDRQMFQTVLFEWTEGGRQTVSDRQTDRQYQTVSDRKTNILDSVV